MNKAIIIGVSTALFTGLLLTAGCSSSSDSSSGGTVGGGVATVPANAIIIDSKNAESTVNSAASVAGTFEGALAVETTPAVGLNTILDVVLPLIKNRSGNAGIDLASGVAVNDSGSCANGGTFSFIGNETDDGTNFSDSGTATFNNCNEGGFTLNGNLTGSSTENRSTGAYSDSFSGSLSIVVNSSSTVTLSMNGINFKETGNSTFRTFTTTALTFSINFVSNGNGSGGFLVDLLQPIVESTGDDCPESGHIRVTGGNGTTAEGIFNGDGTITIKANGTVVKAAATCA